MLAVRLSGDGAWFGSRACPVGPGTISPSDCAHGWGVCGYAANCGAPFCRSAASEALLDGGHHAGLVFSDLQELGDRRDRYVADGDHEGDLSAAFGLDVAGEAVAEHDHLAGGCSHNA